MASYVYHCVHFAAPASCQFGPKLLQSQCFYSHSSFEIKFLRLQSRSILNDESKGSEKKFFGHQTTSKSEDALLRRIQQETHSRKETDRESTPVVRALTWALRGVRSPEAVGVITGDSEFPISIFTTVMQKLGMDLQRFLNFFWLY
jgi:hypothetical protein